MKKKMKRILAAVVTFVMLLGSLPVYAAGGDAERTGNDESASFWLQEYDLNSGLETDKAWYPDESGLIEVPLLDRTTKNNSPLQSYTEYGIALKDVNGLDAYNLYLDFNGIRENSDYDYSTTNYGTFGISADLKAALDSALSQQGFAEFKIEYKGATYTVRLLNEHDQGEQPEEPDQTEAVQHVIELINAIGEVTKESDDAINAAREAYDSLTSEEQGQVSNYDVLEAAEEAYKALLGGVVEIYDENGLREIAADGNYRLMSDIELTAPWTPVSGFAGTLDGNGHVISGLQISGAGFFFSTEKGAVIQNLGLEGTVNHPGYSPAGALVGRANGSTTITGCYTNVAVTADSMEHVGGIVGEARAACVIENCYSLGTLTGGTSFAYSGGIIGRNGSAETTVSNCYTTAAKAVGYSDAAPGSNNYCASGDDAYASQIPKDMDEFLSALNNGGDAYKAGDAGGLGYPVLSWQGAAISDDEAAAAAVEALIDAIGEVTAESGDAIDAARKAYDALTDGQKALVSNYETLTAAEEAYAALDEEPQSSVKVYYVLPDGDPQEVQAGDTVNIAPEYASGQVQLYYEGVPAEESSMTGMRFGDSNFYRVGNSLYFTDAAVSSKVDVVHYNSSYQVDKVYFSFALTREDPDIAKDPSVTYHQDSENRSITLDNGYRFAIPVGDTGKFSYQNVADASEWVSSNPEVAEVQSAGTLTAVGAGETKVSLINAEGEAIYSYTVEVADLKVYYENSDTGEKTEIENGSTFTIPTSGSGKVVMEGNTPGAGKMTIWDVLDEESWNKGVGVGTYTGDITVTSPDTVEVALKGSKSPYLTGTYDFILFRFKLQAVAYEIEELRVNINDETVADGGKWTLEGSASVELAISGKYQGTEKFVSLSRADYEIQGNDRMEISVYDSGTYVEFTEPGEGDLIITYGEGKTHTIHMESTYVPIESMKLELPKTFPLHRLNYALGNGDNYQGLQQNILNAALTVTPANASYIHDVQWSSSDETIGEWWNTFENGIIGHNAGTITVTASVQDGENPVSASDDVTFYWEHPIEKLEAGEDELTIQVGEQASLPIVYTPQQPSQALITWTQEGDGEVEVTRGVNSEYDWFSNTNYYVTGVKEGTVTITGTPAAAAEGTSPSVTFTIHVGSGGEKPVLPDTTELVSTWKASIQKYYEGSEPSWTYGMEWNIIALERAGIDMGVDKEAYLASVKEELADEYGDLTADGKPTDLERTALAMYALGLDPRNIEMEDGSTVDLIQWILDSERISEGTNEAAYALLAVDANAVNIPEGSRWNRDTLMEELLSFQADDGSFVLSKPVSGTGSIDMTAMSLQALSRYTDREDVQAAVDKALDYLKRNINMGDYGTVESNDQVILTLLMLGIAPSDDDSGFTSWGANIFTATDEYRIESGGFAHTKGGAVNEMATQQTLLAVAAWERFAAGENDIYDMTDVMGGEEPEEAQAVIDLIDQIGTVTLENREAIEAARNAYDALTEEQQSYVTNYSVLTAAEAELKALEEQAADQAAADAVTEQINSLPAADALTLEDKAAVEAAREAYEALTDAQKQYVTEETVTALEELENRIQELEDAEEPEQAYVTVAIEKFTIGQGYLVEPVLVEITEGESTAQILDRVLGENGLRYDNTGSVDSSFYLSWILDEAGSLTAEFPEISLKHAEEQGIKITNPRRRATLGEFDYTNHQSGWMYTLNNDMPNVGMSDTEPKDGDVIRIRFTAMKGDLCSGNGYVDDPFVPNVNGDSITKLLAEFNGREDKEELLEYANVQKAYEGAVAAISDITCEQTAVDAAEQALRDAIANPSNPEEPQIPEEAQAVIDLIEEIGTVTLDSREAIEAARNAYDALTEEQQSYVTNYSVLTAAEAELKALEEQAADQAAADAVTEQINSLPAADALTLEDKAAVEAAREAYEALTGNQKALVTEETVQKLANLEAKIAELTDDAEAAAEVEQEIVSLPSAEELTLEDAPAVKTANAHYEALTDEQKSLISADIVEKLQKAVEQMAILEEQAADQAAADAVTEQINSLPAADTLTLADKAAVEAAREAYEALTDAQKQYVTEETMAVLEKCENRIQELESAENPDGPDVTPTPTPDEEVTLTYQNYPISVTGKGLSGWKLRLEALTAFDSDVKLMQKEITSKEALIRLYSAALYKDGQEVQPEGEITLNIQVGEKYNGKTLKVLHVADGKVETLTGTVTEGVLKVTVSTLGKFGTVVDASTVSTGDTGNGSGSGTGSSTAGGAAGTGSVQTGDETDLLPYVSALILAVGAGIVLAVFSRKRSTAEK